MFEQFGEMDSAAEINLLAENLKKEGDYDSIRKLALENGIDADDAEDFIAGDLSELCNVVQAALGKLDLEAKELGCKELMADWVDWIRAACAVKDINGKYSFAESVRRKDRSLAGALGAILKEAWNLKCKVPEKVVKAAGISGARVEFGIPGVALMHKTISNYYGGAK